VEEFLHLVSQELVPAHQLEAYLEPQVLESVLVEQLALLALE
jgi:hypothetical protein